MDIPQKEWTELRDDVRDNGSKIADLSKHTAELTEHVQVTNGRVGALEVIEAVRAGVEKSNTRLLASAIAIGGLGVGAAAIVTQW